MRAVVIDAPGWHDVLRVSDLPAPNCSSGYAVVDVVAAGVNPVDIGNRDDPSWAGIDVPYVVGYEFADEIATVDVDTTDLRVGDPVWAFCRSAAPVGALTRSRLPCRIAFSHPAPRC